LLRRRGRPVGDRPRSRRGLAPFDVEESRAEVPSLRHPMFRYGCFVDHLAIAGLEASTTSSSRPRADRCPQPAGGREACTGLYGGLGGGSGPQSPPGAEAAAPSSFAASAMAPRHDLGEQGLLCGASLALALLGGFIMPGRRRADGKEDDGMPCFLPGEDPAGRKEPFGFVFCRLF